MDTLNTVIISGRLGGRRTRPAIFALEHIPSGRRLIVATKNLSKRLWDQRHYLAAGRHHNKGVQEDLARDGPRAFRFVLLDLVHDQCNFHLLKAFHIAETRRRGLSYHGDVQEPQNELVNPSPLPPPEDAYVPDSALTDAMKRLKSALTFDHNARAVELLNEMMATSEGKTWPASPPPAIGDVADAAKNQGLSGAA